MPGMCAADSNIESLVLPEEDRELLVDLARASIRYGLEKGGPLELDHGTFKPHLLVKRATFVTIEKNSSLRGCIGIIEALRPLAEDIVHNSYAAAFSYPRFAPVTEGEFPELSYHISILGPLEELDFGSESELLDIITPRLDGLILRDGPHSGVFLPMVWEQLPTENSFLAHLKQKAGLRRDYWSDTLRVYRFRTECEFGG